MQIPIFGAFKMTDQNLPDAELEVLACLFRFGKATVREIRETMENYRPMTHGAMVTLLKRLEEKSLVVKDNGKIGKAFIYKPTRKPSSTYQEIIKKLLNRVFGGDGVALVTSLFETKSPTKDELDQLQKMLDKIRHKIDKKRGE